MTLSGDTGNVDNTRLSESFLAAGESMDNSTGCTPGILSVFVEKPVHPTAEEATAWRRNSCVLIDMLSCNYW